METKRIKRMVCSLGLLMLIVLVCGVNTGSAALLNGSFENPVLGLGGATNTFPDWVNEYTYVVEGSPYGGAPDGNQMANVMGYLYQNTGIQMVEGTTYTLSFVTRDVDPLVDSNNIGMMYATNYPAPSVVMNAWLNDSWVNTTGTTWTSAAVNYTCNAANAGKYLMVILTTGDYSHRSLFDNVAVTPEPASMVLLAMGGLMTMLRRKIS